MRLGLGAIGTVPRPSTVIPQEDEATTLSSGLQSSTRSPVQYRPEAGIECMGGLEFYQCKRLG
jgi:hypothetical protein